MTPQELFSAPTAGAILIAVVLIYVLYVRVATPLRSIPGPFLASITNLWVFLKQRGFQRFSVDIGLHKKYGSVVRIGPKEVMFSSPEAFRTIYSAGSRFIKSDWYIGTSDGGYGDPNKLDFLNETNMEKYRLQRRAVGPAYTEQFMHQIEPTIDEVLVKNIQLMRERAGMVVDIDNFFNLFTSDMLSTATFSKPKGLVDSNQDDGSIELIHLAWKTMHVVGYFPIVHKLLAWISHTTKASTKLTNFKAALFPSISRLRTRPLPTRNPFEFALAHLHQRFKARDEGITTSGVDQNDIASKLFDLQSEKGVLKDNWVRDMCLVNFGAGVETTAIVISTLIEKLVSHEGLQERIHREIDSAKKDGTLSNPPKLREMKEHLPFLNACLKESMRLHPVVGMPLPRRVPSDGCEIEGIWIPGGTTVGINPWVLSRSKELYGQDADVWRPERWFHYTHEELQHIDTYNLSFGAGARSCPGKHLAQAIYSKAIPMLFGNLEWSFTNPNAERVLQCTFSTRFIDLKVQWRARGEDSDMI